MTSCANCHQPRDLRLYRIGMGPRAVLRNLCDPCHASLAGLGLAVAPVERRVADAPHSVERRHMFRPAWLERLTARDDTWRAA